MIKVAANLYHMLKFADGRQALHMSPEGELYTDEMGGPQSMIPEYYDNIRASYLLNPYLKADDFKNTSDFAMAHNNSQAGASPYERTTHQKELQDSVAAYNSRRPRGGGGRISTEQPVNDELFSGLQAQPYMNYGGRMPKGPQKWDPARTQFNDAMAWHSKDKSIGSLLRAPYDVAPGNPLGLPVNDDTVFNKVSPYIR